MEALRIYNEIERVGVENEVERSARERSRVEVRRDVQVCIYIELFLVFSFLLSSIDID